MNIIFDFLARFFGSISNFFYRLKRPPVVLESIDPLKLKKSRLKVLLSKDDLAVAEEKELAELASEFEGSVIFIDEPVNAAKEEL